MSTGLSDIAVVNVEYIVMPPVAVDDTSTGNTTGTPVIIVVTGNDTDPDGAIDPTTVSLVGDCDAGSTDANGDCLQINSTAGEGVMDSRPNNRSCDIYSRVRIYRPIPTPIDYNVEDNDGKPIK